MTDLAKILATRERTKYNYKHNIRFMCTSNDSLLTMTKWAHDNDGIVTKDPSASFGYYRTNSDSYATMFRLKWG